MKKLLAFALGCIMLLSFAGCAKSPQGNSGNSDIPQYVRPGIEVIEKQTEQVYMTKAEKEFETMLDDLSLFPVNFVYGDAAYRGFPTEKFLQISRRRTDDGAKITAEYEFMLGSVLKIILNATYYRGYEAYDYTVYFENVSQTDNTEIISCLNAIDMRIEGGNAVLKGILGDHGNQYEPYEYNLSERDVSFVSLAGRATHGYFPYFNLENDDGGAIFAIGWGGTWQADFVYDKGSRSTRFSGTGTVGLETYLKPGETIRTPLIAKVSYYERDEDKAMNLWRKWMIDCNLPRQSAESEECVQPFRSFCLALDTGRPNSDGSISEGYDTWQNSMDAFYCHGLTAEFRWVDAGWYFDPYGKTVASDWWGTVGTWELDTVKWPNDSFKQSVDYARERGSKTFLWFEPERVTHLDGMVNYGYNREWALSDHGNNNCYLNNIGNKDCLDWTVSRIIKVMDENGIDLYREDFNFDPYIFWDIGDGYEGSGRKGITENLYMQGHYALFDAIIDYCGKNGKCTFVDSCASGGGRNDLETMRRAVPLLRSDSDRTTIELRLAMTTRLARWLPFTGAASSESAAQLEAGGYDIYTLRASMLPHTYLQAEFYHKQDLLDWDVLKRGETEWKEISKYFYSDFYVLTPFRSTTDRENWTVYEYFDSETDGGVVQAFRLPECNEEVYMAKVKGVNPDRYYVLRDVDGVNSFARIKGSALMKGLPIRAAASRSAVTIYIEALR